MKRQLEVIGVLIALATLAVAVFAWLAPFGPIAPSPLSPQETMQVGVVAATAPQPTAQPEGPSLIPTLSPTLESVRLTTTVQRITQQPTPTKVPPTATPQLPTATAIPTSQPQVMHAEYARGNPPIPAPLGWAYENEGVQLNLVRAEIRSDTDSGSAAARLWFALSNKTPQRLLVEFDQSQTYIRDSRGTRYVDYDGPGIQSFWIEPGESRIIDRYYTTTPQRESRIPPSALPVIVQVDRVSRIQGAQWTIGASPIRTFSDGDPAGQVGQSLKVDDFEVTLINLEIRTTTDSGSAAFYAEFRVKNKSSQRKLLELDYAYVYVEDNFGTRYIDYDGAGLISTWLDPSQEYDFYRYYTTEYNKGSRVPIGTSYIVVICEGIGSGARAQWRIDISR